VANFLQAVCPTFQPANNVRISNETKNTVYRRVNSFKKISLLTSDCVSVVARKKSLFDDKSDDIQQLTLVIKQDIGTLNRQIGQLQEV